MRKKGVWERTTRRSVEKKKGTEVERMERKKSGVEMVVVWMSGVDEKWLEVKMIGRNEIEEKARGEQ